MTKDETKFIKDGNRFFWNPKTKEKIFTHRLVQDLRTGKIFYEEIKLTDEQKANGKQFAEICTELTNTETAANVKLRLKPEWKRKGMKKKPKESIDVNIVDNVKLKALEEENKRLKEEAAAAAKKKAEAEESQKNQEVKKGRKR